MSPAPPRKGLLAVLGLLAAVAAARFWPEGAPVPSAPARPSGAVSVPRPGGTPATPAQIPPLELGQGRGEIGGAVVRNVFAFHVPPTATPKPVTPTPTPLPAPCTPRFVGPCRPAPTPTPTPIVAPPIPYRAVGVFGPRDRPIVTFEDGARLINAREGDVLDGRFILRRVGRESVDFAFVGLPPEITRRVPVLPPDAPR
ncbi:MAG: hypothetical protein U0529_21665 [Thermoanaerobaculia bacterium]